MQFDYDVIVIGSGPAGFSCAMQSSKFDKKVLIVEANKEFIGGAWINTGTVPSKALREAAKTIYRFHSQFGDEKGRKPFERFRMEELLQYKKTILETKNRKVKEDLIKNEVDTVRGFGKILDNHTVSVTSHTGNIETYTADHILISTGSSPTSPDNFEIDQIDILNYESILDLTHIPRRLTIIGAGIIAMEYATIFASLGTRVNILNENKDLLLFLDHEIRNMLNECFKNRNVIIHNNVKIESVRKNDLRNRSEVVFKIEDDENRLQVIETEHVLYIGGKKPNSKNIGLEEAGIQTDEDGYIETSNSYKTSVENIYAAGDVIGFPSLASTSFVQGRLAACDMFGIPSQDTSGDIPFGIYSLPEISGIGLTEDDAIKMGIDVTVGRAYFRNITQGDISHLDEGLLKLVFSTNDLKLLGVHILGESAADMIHLGQSVMYFNGDIRYFIQTVLNYPTYSEAYRIAAFNGFNRVYKAGVKYQKILESSSD
ncbi:MAG: Si-specific NAD(P)(+) transhydrogenase [Balneolaceae bacterium]